MNSRLTRLLPLFGLLAGFLAASLWPDTVTTVILVRHAEKSATPPDDPLLSSAGSMRAIALAGMLKEAGIDVIISSEYQRTRATVAPLAKTLGLEPLIFPAREQGELIAAIGSAYRGQTVLISGHSNTVPSIMADLGVHSLSEISEQEYDNLFMVTVRHRFMSSTTHMTTLKY
ncbi:MAG: histidine phosphatase family protein [Candidatus Marinimicrobia bacterium]|nr:histidine phosphatase family protein [Candidatus Neomarinimicrobiota bacterium]